MLRLIAIIVLLAGCEIAQAFDGEFETKRLVPTVPLSPEKAEDFKKMALAMQQSLSFSGDKVKWIHHGGLETTLSVSEHGAFLLMEQPFADNTTMYYTAYLKGGRLYFNGNIFERK